MTHSPECVLAVLLQPVYLPLPSQAKSLIPSYLQSQSQWRWWMPLPLTSGETYYRDKWIPVQR